MIFDVRIIKYYRYGLFPIARVNIVMTGILFEHRIVKRSPICVLEPIV